MASSAIRHCSAGLHTFEARGSKVGKPAGIVRALNHLLAAESPTLQMRPTQYAKYSDEMAANALPLRPWRPLRFPY